MNRMSKKDIDLLLKLETGIKPSEEEVVAAAKRGALNNRQGSRVLKVLKETDRRGKPSRNDWLMLQLVLAGVDPRHAKFARTSKIYASYGLIAEAFETGSLENTLRQVAQVMDSWHAFRSARTSQLASTALDLFLVDRGRKKKKVDLRRWDRGVYGLYKAWR